MDLELKRTIFKVSIYGEVFEMRRPTAAEYKQFTKDVASGVTEESAVGHMEKLLSKCGVPVEKIQGMEFEHLTELFNAVCGSKKK